MILVRLISALLLAVTFVSCANQEILPDEVDVKVGRELPSDKCTLVGTLTASSGKIGGSSEEALENLKEAAARKGANFILYESASATGSAMKGTAYSCE